MEYVYMVSAYIINCQEVLSGSLLVSLVKNQADGTKFIKNQADVKVQKLSSKLSVSEVAINQMLPYRVRETLSEVTLENNWKI